MGDFNLDDYQTRLHILVLYESNLLKLPITKMGFTS